MNTNFKKITSISCALLLGLGHAVPLQAQNHSGIKARFPNPTPENCAALYQIYCIKPTKNQEIRLFCSICNIEYEEF